MLKIIIVDDDRTIAKNMRKALQNYNCEVEIAHNYKDAIELIDTYKPQFAFLDIDLKDENDGINIAEYLNSKGRIPFIYLSIHITNESNFYERALATRPAEYLPKGTFLSSHLWHFVNVAMDKYANNGNVLINKEEVGLFARNEFFIKKAKNWELVNTSRITHISIESSYCKINVINPKGVYSVRHTLENLMELLLDIPVIRIHQSHAINTKYIHKYNPTENTITLIDNSTLSVSRNYKKELESKMNFL